jgi:hypothetical protein
VHVIYCRLRPLSQRCSLRLAGLQYGEPGCLEAIQLLAQHGADLLHSSAEGTALHIACKHGSGELGTQVLQLLLELMQAAGPPSRPGECLSWGCIVFLLLPLIMC